MNKYLLAILLYFLTTSLLAQPTALSDPNAEQSLSQSLATLDNFARRVETFTLSNGLRVIFYRRGIAPVFSGALVVRVGSVDEPDGLTGASHMFEHMAFKGTHDIGTKDHRQEAPLLEELELLMAASRDRELTALEQAKLGELQEALAKLWIVNDFDAQYRMLGGEDLNATTDVELTRFFIDLPSNAFEHWCYLESERLVNPVMRQFYEERDVVREERRMRYEDDPGGKLYEKIKEVAYLEHPYRRPVIGYDRDLERLTMREVEAFRKRYYVPSNMVISVVGGLELAEVKSKLERYFGRIPAGPSPSAPKVVEPKQRDERKMTVNFNASPQLMIAYHKPQYPHPDDAPFAVMLKLLAGSRVAPMYTELVEKLRIATSISYEEAPGRMYPNLVIFVSAPKSPHTNQEIVDAFDRVLDRFQISPLTSEEILIAKRSLVTAGLGGLAENRSLALDLATSEIAYGGWDSLLKWYRQILEVEEPDIRRVAAEYLVQSNRTLGFLERGQDEKR